MAKLEIACFKIESAYVAAKNGADRIEFCDHWELGGTTPELSIVKQIRQDIELDVTIMIRPRGGDFRYTSAEFNAMKNSIEEFKALSIQGFVFGILHPNNTIDLERCKILIDAAGDIPCILHRAFDKTPVWETALDQAISCGFSTILTSGHASNVSEGLENLTKLVAKAQDKIEIMPGGGLRSENIGEIQEKTKASFFHSSAILDTSGIADPREMQALIANLKKN